VGRLTFIGAAGVVTGSKHLIETDSGARVLLDCGMFQGLRDLTERNWIPPPVDAKHLDAVLISHGHLDHCGYLPALMQQGFAGPIYATPATADVAALVLHDSAGLQQDEAARAQRHPDRGLHTKALYTDADVTAVTKQFRPVGYGEQRSDIAGCRFEFVDAGHILGSSITRLWFEKSVLTYTGDLGRYGRPLLNDPTAIQQSDYVLCEATYGDRDHPATNPQDDLCAAITTAMQRRGVLVIPAFAIGRTQDILYAIGQLQQANRIPQCSIYVDSPMGIAADEMMANHPEATRFDLRARFGPAAASMGAQRVTLACTTDQSKALNAIASDAIIISASGMASGGRILHHLRNRLPRANDTVLFVGFQGPGTIGNTLKNGAKSVNIMGVKVAVNAHIASIAGFSAHADRSELLRWFGGFANKPTTFLVHADPNVAAAFAPLLQQRTGIVATPARAGQVVDL
jgi:metallo-beta-lactamase family protein